MMHSHTEVEPPSTTEVGAPSTASAGRGKRSLVRGAGRLLSSSFFITLLSLGLIVLIWQSIIWVTGMESYILPSPREVFDQLVNSRDVLKDAFFVTLKEVLIGFAIACGVGFPIGIGIAFSRVIERLIYPLVVGSQAIPVIAIAPLFLVWFGFGDTPKVLVAALIAFFPIVIGTVAGLRAIDPAMIHMARACGAPAPRIFRKIRVPVALPNVFSGLKLAITFSVIGAVVGEFVAGTSGLGYVVQYAEGNQQADLAFAAIILLAAMSLSLFYIVEAIEHRLIRGTSSSTRGARRGANGAVA